MSQKKNQKSMKKVEHVLIMVIYKWLKIIKTKRKKIMNLMFNMEYNFIKINWDLNIFLKSNICDFWRPRLVSCVMLRKNVEQFIKLNFTKLCYNIHKIYYKLLLKYILGNSFSQIARRIIRVQ